ncbi:MAG: SCO family protein [Anaerolineae bacterium]|nr:SCO family protein [Candidatus Roseilinea sp.]MDW8451585.1 SCO family protein [Anaerolineae bacterium]
MTPLKTTAYACFATLLCAGMIAGAPIAGRLAQLGVVRARMHLRMAWRTIAPLALPEYTDAPLQRAIHLHAPLRPPNVTFVNGHMDPFTLDELRGYGVLLFFGTRDCDGLCPHVLKQFTRVKAALGAHASRVRFVMIGVDAGRDRPHSLLRLVRSYDPDFMALTADAQTAVPFAHKHGVTVLQASRQTGSALVPLTPYIIYLNPQGLWTMCFPPDVPAEEIADEIIYSLAF